MSRFFRETEYSPAARKHCRTCICQETDPVRRLSSPRTNPYRSRYTCIRHQDHGCCRPCHLSQTDDWDEESEVFREHRHIFSSTKIERKNDRKFAVLEKWFKEFDFDGNGLIDMYELQRLLDYLGVKCDQEYVKDLIQDADRDNDGMLSFSDFLHMWNQVASDDFDNLINVVKEHDLYPDILPAAKHHQPKLVNRSQNVKEARKYEPQREYSCCEYISKKQTVERKPFKTKEMQKKSKIKHSPSNYSEDLPLLSCHR